MAFAGSTPYMLALLFISSVWLQFEYVHSQRSCTRSRGQTSTRSSVAYTSTSYSQSYGCGFWDWRRCHRTRYRSSSMVTYRTVTTYRTACCAGYGCPGVPSCYACCSPDCRNGGTCISPNSCSCTTGWEGSYCQSDIDECSRGLSLCAHTCHNTNGNYYCSCRNGYYLDNEYYCNDVNECAVNNGGCHHDCVNSEGSYECLCNDEYQLNTDGHTCEVPPLPPTNIVLSDVGKRMATISWRLSFVSFSNSLTAIAEYEIKLSQEELALPDIIVTVSSDQSRYTLSGTLEEFIEYTCSIRARNEFGWSSPSNNVTFHTLPDVPSGPPLNVTGVSQSSTLLLFNWSAPYPVDINGILQYYIAAVIENETSRSWRLHAVDSFLFLGGLHPYYHYECQVAAFANGLGPFSSPITVVTHEDVPSGAPSTPLVSILSPYSIWLEWQPPAANKQNGIIIQYNLELMETESGNSLYFVSNTTSIEVEALHPFYHYICRVLAVTIAPGPYSVEITIQLPETAPSGPPSNVTGMAVNATAICVSWDTPNFEDQNGVITRYSVGITELETSNARNITTELNEMEIRFLHPYYIYEIVVSASTRVATGPPSEPIFVTTMEDIPSGAPQNVSAVNLSPNSVVVHWSAPKPHSQNGVIVEYLVTVENGDIEELSSNCTEMMVENLEPFTVYKFGVAAMNAIGLGPFSAPFTLRTLEDGPSRPPVNITIAVLGPRTLALMWGPPELAYQHGIITEYKVRLEVISDLDEGVLENSTASTAIVLTGLHPYYTYSYTIAAHTVSTGVYSNATTIQMPEDVPSSSPLAILVSNVTSTSAVLSWEPPPSEDHNGVLAHFVVDVASIVTGEVKSFELQGYSMDIENLHPFYTYACVIAAATEVGHGPFSSAVEFKTEEAAPSGAPENFNGSVIDSMTVLLSWRLPLQHELNGIVRSYVVSVENSHGLYSYQLSTTSLSITSLHPYYTYHFQVAAFTIDIGPFTEVVTLTTLQDVPSGSPTNVFWEASSRSIYLTWNPPSDEHQNGVITGYTVRYTELRSGEELEIDSEYENATILMLTPFTTYGVTIVAYTEVGAGPATQLLSITTLEEAPIGQPTNLTVVTVGKTYIHLEWEHPAEDTHYGVIREYRVNVTELESGSMSRLVTDGEDTAVTIRMLHPYYTYYITIVPFTVDEGSDYTEITVRTEEDAPSMAPTNVTFSDVLSTQLVLSWAPLPNHSKNGIIRHYVLNLTAVETGSFQLLTTMVTTVTIPGLKPYTKYVFSVAAYTVSTGPFSTESCVWTEQDVPSASPVLSSVRALGPTTLALTWLPLSTAQLNGIIFEYKIVIQHLESNDTTLYTSSTTEREIENLLPFRRYSAQIAASTVVGFGPLSQPYTVEMPEDAPSAPPRNLTVADITASSVFVSWLPPPSMHHNGIIRHYIIDLTEINSGRTFTVTSQNTSKRLDFLHPSYRYSLSVSAVTVLVGPLSDPTTFTTMEAVPTGVPLNISTVNTTSSALHLKWSPPLPQHQNGIIIGYVLVIEDDKSSSQEHLSNFTSFTVSSLLPYTTYGIKIASVNSAGIGPFTVTVLETTLEDAPSSPPTNITHVEITARSVYITWSEPDERNGIIRYYAITILEEETGLLCNVSAAFPEALIMPLHPFYTYSIKVAAFTVSGGPYSADYIVKTLEDVPSTYPNLTSLDAATSTSVVLAWLPLTTHFANGIIQNYILRVYEQNPITGVDLRNFEIATNATDHSIEDLHPYYTYLIQLAAKTEIGIGPFSDGDIITTPEEAPSSAPRNLSGDVISSTTIYVSWSQPNYDTHNGIIKYFELHILEMLSGDIITHRESGASSSAIIPGLHPYYEYGIKVAAVTIGVGPFTSGLTLTTLEDAPSGPPLNVSGAALDSTNCFLLWNPPNETMRNGVIRSYVIEVYQNNSAGMRQITVNASTSEIIVEDLHPSYEYRLRVAAVTTDVGVFSSELTVITLEDVPSQSPHSLDVMFQNSSGVLLKWDAPSKEEQNGIITHYVINITEHKADLQSYVVSYSTGTFLTLSPFSEYSVSVSASTQIGSGPFSEAVIIITAEQSPSVPPSNVTVQHITSTSIVLAWRPVPQAVANGIVRFYSVEVLEMVTNGARILNTSSNMFGLNISDLHPFYMYNLSVSAVTVSAGPYSDPVSSTTHQDVPRGPPRNITVTSVGKRSYTINWEPPLPEEQNGIIQSYLIWILTVNTDEQTQVSVPANEGGNQTYTVLGLHPHYNYTFTLRAVTIGSGVESRIVSVQLLEEAPSDVPQNITFVPLSATSLMLSWTPPPIHNHNGVIDSYTIVMDVLDTKEHMNISSKNSNFVLDSLHPFYTYNFTIAAVNSAGHGPYSSPSRVQMPESSPAGAVRNFTAVVKSSTEVKLSWIPQDPDMWNGIIMNYTIECNLIGPIGHESSENNITTTFKRSSFTQNSVDPRTASLPLLVESIIISNLLEHHEYRFAVYMFNSAGKSERSTAVVVQVQGAVPSGPPTAVVVRVTSSTSLEVSWGLPRILDQNGVILGYIVTIFDPVHEANNLYNISGTHLTVHGLHPFEEYSVAVKAWSEYGLGPLSDTVAALTFEDVPGPPSNVSVRKVNKTSVLLSWNNPAHPNGIIRSYEIVYSGTFSNNESNVVDGPHNITVNSSINKINISNLNDNLVYSFKIRAATSVGYGKFSLPMTDDEQVHQEGSNTTLFSGLAVTGLALTVLIIAIGTVVCFCYWKKTGRKSRVRSISIGLQFSNATFGDSKSYCSDSDSLVEQ